MKVGPFQVVSGIGFVAWVAWMISVQVDYEESREIIDSPAIEAGDPATAEDFDTDTEPMAEHLAVDDWDAEDPADTYSDADWGPEAQ